MNNTSEQYIRFARRPSRPKLHFKRGANHLTQVERLGKEALEAVQETSQKLMCIEWRHVDDHLPINPFDNLVFCGLRQIIFIRDKTCVGNCFRNHDLQVIVIALNSLSTS